MWDAFNPYNGCADSCTSPDDGTWVDGACVVAVRNDGAMRVAWSDTITIPAVAARPFEKGAHACEWSEIKDPYFVLVGKHRQLYLTNALSRLSHKCHNSTLVTQVQWGIIGVGAVCEKKSGPAFYKCTGSKLVAVIRRTGALAQSFAKRHNVPAWYDTVEFAQRFQRECSIR
jgi:hypothetical protein